ncbi:MAG TPA: hypothetical protein VKA81_00565 [Verrucomicrobiae bacterium]|nr:hypothetical protein [Verrucomicrobiae bacterium]
MRHLLPALCVCLALNLSARDTPPAETATSDAAQPRPIYRYLFLFDTSSSMSRQKAIAADTAHQLILSGIYGRMRAGDTFGLWTFDERLHTNAFPSVMWDPRRRRDTANRAYRFLLGQRFNKKDLSLNQALDAMTQEAKTSGALTVFLFTDGREPVKGTPFDEAINAIFTKHAAGMRKAKKPFVTVFVAQDGQFATNAVTPGGEPIYIPRLANTTAPAEMSEQESNARQAQAAPATKPEPTATENTATAQTRKKPLTVEEISAALRQSPRKQTNAAAPASPVLRGESSTNPVAAGEVSNPNAGTPAPASGPSSPAQDIAAVQNRSVAGSSPPAVTPAAPARNESNAPTENSTSTPAKTILPSARPKEEYAIAAAETPRDKTDQSPASSSTPPETAVIFQPEAASNALKYLAAAGGLLLVALTLAWLYIRSVRYVPRPSLISQSLDKETK